MTMRRGAAGLGTVLAGRGVVWLAALMSQAIGVVAESTFFERRGLKAPVTQSRGDAGAKGYRADGSLARCLTARVLRVPVSLEEGFRGFGKRFLRTSMSQADFSDFSGIADAWW
jgi:hypothetical protein